MTAEPRNPSGGGGWRPFNRWTTTRGRRRALRPLTETVRHHPRKAIGGAPTPVWSAEDDWSVTEELQHVPRGDHHVHAQEQRVFDAALEIRGANES